MEIGGFGHYIFDYSWRVLDGQSRRLSLEKPGCLNNHRIGYNKWSTL